MQEQVKQRKILVLSGAQAQFADLLEPFQTTCEIITVDSVEQALAKLQECKFDAVFSETCNFLPLERANVADQATTILNTIGEGVCIVGPEGAITWANRQMERFDLSVKQSVSQWSQQAYKLFQQHLAPDGKVTEKHLSSRKYSFTHPETDRYFEMISTPMLDSQGSLTHIATVVWEATASRRLQQRIDAIDKAGRELVRLEADAITTMTVEQRISLLQDKIIRYARELLHFDHFVVRLLNRQTNQLEVLFGVGLTGDQETELFAHSQNNGITGYVAATGRSYICNNPENDPHYLPGLDNARCSLTVPLRLHDKVIGTMNVESDKEAAFNEDDRQVADIFGRYIAVSLNILNLLVVERYQTTGQAAQNFCSQLAEPLSQIMTKASLLMEDYIGHDDLRQKLRAIIDHITEIKQSLKDLHIAPGGILGAGRKSVSSTPDLVGKHILVVDDEQIIRQTISDVLQNSGCIVDLAQDGREANSLIGQNRYDLVISDIKLPHASGYEIFAAAHAVNIPVILMTGFGYDPNHSIVRANRDGLSAVLYKPFKADQLLSTIQKAVSTAKK